MRRQYSAEELEEMSLEEIASLIDSRECVEVDDIVQEGGL